MTNDTKLSELTKWEEVVSKTGRRRLNLIDGGLNRVLLIYEENGSVIFEEGCDQYYWAKLSKNDAKQALLEAIEWIDINIQGIEE